MTLDFELSPVGTGIPGIDITSTYQPMLTFTNAFVTTSFDLSLDAPSGIGYAWDFGGPVTVSFAVPVLSVAANFYFLQPLTITAVDALGGALSPVVSSLVPATGFERLSLSSSAGIRSIVITGAAAGQSFIFDEFAYEIKESENTPIPEPQTYALIIVGGLCLSVVRKPAA